MSSNLPFMISLLGLNTNAKEFIPTSSKPTSSKPTSSKKIQNKPPSIVDENLFFDNLEKDFVKNNEWLFFH
jgi:hypothetical protein